MKALLLIDIQNDFLPGGALAVSDGDTIIPVANKLIPNYELVIATQDWHPGDHLCFASQHGDKEVGHVIDLNGVDQVLWPDHCVQGSPGAEFVAELDRCRIDHVCRKGTDRAVDSYSGFFDNARLSATGLEKLLNDRQVRSLHVMGLATDYCVKFTVLDAMELGFRTTLIVNGCRAVDRYEGDGQRAIDEMKAAGALVASL